MEGGCHCGAIRFRTSGEPGWVGACYCSDCRKVSGSPYTVFAEFPTERITMISGEPKAYYSSKNVNRSFCENCSSPFAFTYNDKPETRFIPIGVFDNASSFAPAHHIFVAEKLPWTLLDTHTDVQDGDIQE